MSCLPWWTSLSTLLEQGKNCSLVQYPSPTPLPPSTTLPSSTPNTNMVTQNESHEKNVCQNRRTELMIASCCGVPSTHSHVKPPSSALLPPSTSLPASTPNTNPITQDESHEKNVCQNRSTEFMIASCGAPSTHSHAKPLVCHSTKLGSWWEPPPQSLKPMSLHFYNPWRIFLAKTNPSLRTVAAHKASDYIHSHRSHKARENSRKIGLKGRGRRSRIQW